MENEIKEPKSEFDPIIMASKAHPTDHLIKSRRVLLTYAGLLILLTALPSDPQNSGEVLQKIESIWPIKFDPPLSILNPHLVVACLVIYAVWRYFSEWYVQLDEVRNELIGRADCIVTGLIIALAGTFFYRSTEYFPTWDCPLTFPAIVFFTLAIWYFVFIEITEFLYERAADQIVENEKIIINTIKLHEVWEMEYNPDVLNGKKDIIFGMEYGPGGLTKVINKGKNSNEHSWRPRNKYLEIYKKNGEVHNRFKYNPKANRFENTNDPDVDAIGRQYIRPKPRNHVSTTE